MMLINTVILLLRDLMPLCILFSFILVLRPQIFNKRIFTLLFWPACFIVPILSFIAAEAVSDAFDAQGAEILGIALLIAQYICLLFATFRSPNKIFTAWMLAIGAIALITFKGSSLVLYLDIYLQQTALWQPLLVGVLIGLGICISVFVLLRFLLLELFIRRQIFWVMLIWCLFLAGNAAGVSNLLLQINAVDWGAQTAFDLSSYIDDASEYGHLLNALVGFDATPTVLGISIYLVCISFAAGLLARRWRRPNDFIGQEEITP